MRVFLVDMTLSNPTNRRRSATIPLLASTRATDTTLSRETAEALGLEVIDTRLIRLNDDREERWPIAPIFVSLEGHEAPSLALIGPQGSPALLGAVVRSRWRNWRSASTHKADA